MYCRMLTKNRLLHLSKAHIVVKVFSAKPPRRCFPNQVSTVFLLPSVSLEKMKKQILQSSVTSDVVLTTKYVKLKLVGKLRAGCRLSKTKTLFSVKKCKLKKLYLILATSAPHGTYSEEVINRVKLHVYTPSSFGGGKSDTELRYIVQIELNWAADVAQ